MSTLKNVVAPFSKAVINQSITNTWRNEIMRKSYVILIDSDK
ncbi:MULTISPECIES: hypothetical protein [Flavobacterium]|nr:hypothetical protein [Flavobacterium weaverense]